MKSTGAPKQTEIAMGYSQVKLIQSPEYAWDDGEKVVDPSRIGPFLAYSKFEYEGVLPTRREHQIRRSTFAKIAGIEKPEDAFPIIQETGELGIKPYKLSVVSTEEEGGYERFYADRWLAWQNEILRWSAFMIVVQLELNPKSIDLPTAKERLNNLNEIHNYRYDVPEGGKWLETAPGPLVTKL